ncbi:MAG TPA: MFS transporter [Clostridia bacterium]|nr:MFS transporter [Clostridia bacterium]
MREQRKLFYGWVIVAASMLIMMTAYAIVCNCFAFYIAPVTKELGFSQQNYSLSQSIVFVAMTCVAPFVGAVYRRLNILHVMRLAALVHVASYAAYGLCRELWQFYLVSAALGAAQCFMTTIPLSIIIRNWFERSYGLALGFAFMGSGIGGMLFGPVVRALIDAFGWRSTFLAMALIMAAVNVVTMFFLIRLKPSDKGLEPLRDLNARAEAAEPAPTGLSLARTLKSVRFYVILILFVVFGTGSYGLVSYTSPYFAELGHPVAVATLCASLGLGFLAPGKVFYGRMLDRLGLKPSAMISVGAMVLGFVGMIFAKSLWTFPLVLIGIVFACPFATVTPAICVRDVFGTRDFGAKMGFYSAAGTLGMALSPFFYGAVYDATGGYYTAMLLLAFVSAALVFAYALAIPGKGKSALAREA